MPSERLRLAELINGRAAMIGCSAVGVAAIAIKANVMEGIITQHYQSFWWMLGIYAG